MKKTADSLNGLLLGSGNPQRAGKLVWSYGVAPHAVTLKEVASG
jgi:hypothetical protein